MGYIICYGEVAEWLKAHAWKACKGVTLSRVRIPLSPPLILKIFIIIISFSTTTNIIETLKF